MNLKLISAPILTVLAVSTAAFAQDPGAEPTPRQTPPPVVKTGTPTPTPPTVRLATPTPAPTVKLSETLARNLENLSKNGEITRELREQAYSKLLEGQRYLWAMRQRSQTGSSGVRLARQAFQKAVELNPTLAEGYTALAEITLTTPPGDMNEAIALALLAVKIDKNNFGAHRILSRLYTIKSGLNEGNLDPTNTERAIIAWKEITRLDPRNAEAWAFLSEFYRRTNKTEDRISALKNWQSSATPIETRFYRTVLGTQENLSPEGATAKLGEALYDAGRIPESVAILNQALSDDPENQLTVEMLAKALDKADPATAASSVQTLQQAIYANPENMTLVMLLAKIQSPGDLRQS
jgi:tetratricopeptide (TPR) repeat protein